MRSLVSPTKRNLPRTDGRGAGARGLATGCGVEMGLARCVATFGADACSLGAVVGGALPALGRCVRSRWPSPHRVFGGPGSGPRPHCELHAARGIEVDREEAAQHTCQVVTKT